MNELSEKNSVSHVWRPSERITVAWHRDGYEAWCLDGVPVTDLYAHVHLREPEQEKGVALRASTVRLEPDEVALAAETERGTYRARYHVVPDGVRLDVSFTFAQDWFGGLDLHLFRRPAAYTRCRFYDMMVSGWSNRERGIVFEPLFEGAAKLTVVMFDQGEVQMMALSVPAGEGRGVRDFRKGETVSGTLLIRAGNVDLYNPDIAGPMTNREVAPPPARTYPEYIRLWENFTRRPGLWIDLDSDADMGMFHRGWYGFLSEREKVSGALVTTQFKPPKDSRTLDEPLVELAWGGSANVVLMETLFRLGDPRARKILNALLYFKDGGFQHENGSWINGYQVSEDQFSDRYARPHSEVPSGGMVNYFVWRCIKRGYVPDEEKRVFVERLQRFCDVYLEALRSSETGGIAFGRFWDGRQSNEALYNGETLSDPCYAISDAFAMNSFLIAYLLTKDTTALNRYRHLLRHLLTDHLARNDWRFLEYDTVGADAIAPSYILLALDMALEHEELLDEPLRSSAWEQFHRTYRALHSFVREREDYSNAEWRAPEAFGLKAVTQGGVIHSSTAGSPSGLHSVHLRPDMPLAMGAYARRTGNAVARTDWESYLNWATWQQYIDPRWPSVIGSVTEHVTFNRGGVQDTAQIHHSNPLAMLEWLEYMETKK